MRRGWSSFEGLVSKSNYKTFSWSQFVQLKFHLFNNTVSEMISSLQILPVRQSQKSKLDLSKVCDKHEMEMVSWSTKILNPLMPGDNKKVTHT